MPSILQGLHILRLPVCIPVDQSVFLKGPAVKGTNLLPRGANSNVLQWTTIWRGGKTIQSELIPLKLYPFSKIKYADIFVSLYATFRIQIQRL